VGRNYPLLEDLRGRNKEWGNKEIHCHQSPSFASRDAKNSIRGGEDGGCNGKTAGKRW